MMWAPGQFDEGAAMDWPTAPVPIKLQPEALSSVPPDGDVASIVGQMAARVEDLGKRMEAGNYGWGDIREVVGLAIGVVGLAGTIVKENARRQAAVLAGTVPDKKTIETKKAKKERERREQEQERREKKQRQKEEKKKEKERKKKEKEKKKERKQKDPDTGEKPPKRQRNEEDSGSSSDSSADEPDHLSDIEVDEEDREAEQEAQVAQDDAAEEANVAAAEQVEREKRLNEKFAQQMLRESGKARKMAEKLCYGQLIQNKTAQHHQAAICNYLRNGPILVPALMIAHNMGEGKTITAMLAAKCIRERIAAEKKGATEESPLHNGTLSEHAPILVVMAPVNMVAKWAQELSDSGLSAWIVVKHTFARNSGRKATDWIVSPDIKKRIRKVVNGQKDKMRNGGSTPFASWDWEKIIDEAEYKGYAMSRKHRMPYIMVVDESHQFLPQARQARHNHTAPGVVNATRFLSAFAQRALFTMFMTATPFVSNVRGLAGFVSAALATGSRWSGPVAAAFPFTRWMGEQKRPRHPEDLEGTASKIMSDFHELVKRSTESAAIVDAPDELDDSFFRPFRYAFSFRGVPQPDPTMPRPGFPTTTWDFHFVKACQYETTRLGLNATAVADQEEKHQERFRQENGGTLKMLPVSLQITPFKMRYLVQLAIDLSRTGKGMVVFNHVEGGKPRVDQTADDAYSANNGAVTFAEMVQSNPAVMEATELAKQASPDFRFVTLLAGESTNRIAKAVSDFDNDLTKVLVISRSSSTGMDLKGCRWVILAQPFWARTSTLQAAARAVRFKSHADLKQNERVVAIHEVVALGGWDGESTAEMTRHVYSDEAAALFLSQADTREDQSGEQTVLLRALTTKKELDKAATLLCQRCSLEKNVFGLDPCHRVAFEEKVRRDLFGKLSQEGGEAKQDLKSINAMVSKLVWTPLREGVAQTADMQTAYTAAGFGPDKAPSRRPALLTTDAPAPAPAPAEGQP